MSGSIGKDDYEFPTKRLISWRSPLLSDMVAPLSYDMKRRPLNVDVYIEYIQIELNIIKTKNRLNTGKKKMKKKTREKRKELGTPASA